MSDFITFLTILAEWLVHFKLEKWPKIYEQIKLQLKSYPVVQLAYLDIDASWFYRASRSKVMVVVVILANLANLASKSGHFALEIAQEIHEIIKLELKS